MTTNDLSDPSVIGKYVSTISSGDILKISTVDLHDSQQVINAARIGMENKQLVADVSNAHRITSMQLVAALKSHLNARTADFNQDRLVYSTGKNDEMGSLKFQKPTMYLVSQTGSTGIYSQMVSPSDDLLAYQFLLFRDISGKDAYDIGPKGGVEFFISFRDNVAKMYSKADILNSFEYKVDKTVVYPFSQDEKTGQKRLNTQTVELLKAEKEEVTAIVKNVFSSFAEQCYKLSQASAEVMQEVCKKAHYFGDPDYALSMFTCFEVFQMTKIAGFCVAPDYDSLEINF